MNRVVCASSVLVLLLVSSACGSSGGGGGRADPVNEFHAFAGFVYYQYDFVNVEPPVLNAANTAYGGVLYQLDLPAGNYFLNTTTQSQTATQWQVRNLPVTTPGGPYQFYVSIDLGGFQQNPNDNVQQIDQVSTISTLPLLDTTFDFTTVNVFDETLSFGSGKFDPGGGRAPVVIAPPNGQKYTFVWDGMSVEVDTAGHGAFTNQECGISECVPAAVSNSLKTIGVAAGSNDISDARGLVGFNPAGGGGSPARWDLTKAAGTAGAPYNLNTTQLDPKGDNAAGRIQKICQAKDALANGADVEIDSPSHCAMVTRITKTTSGGTTKYYIWVAHDTNQGNAGGTKQEVMEYDPATNMFSGGMWFDGNVCDQIIIETKK